MEERRKSRRKACVFHYQLESQLCGLPSSNQDMQESSHHPLSSITYTLLYPFKILTIVSVRGAVNESLTRTLQNSRSGRVEIWYSES